MCDGVSNIQITLRNLLAAIRFIGVSLALLWSVILGACSPAAAQVIQLPTFHSFSVNTTVVVPDRGAASLGGSTAARSGSSIFSGLPGNRALGFDRHVGGAGAHVMIHDQREADEALLQAAQARRAGAKPPQSPRTVAAEAAPLKSLAQIERERSGEEAAARQEAAAWLAKARAAAGANKQAVARIYYRSAVKSAPEPLKPSIEAEARRSGAAEQAARTAGR